MDQRGGKRSQEVFDEGRSPRGGKGGMAAGATKIKSAAGGAILADLHLG